MEHANNLSLGDEVGVAVPVVVLNTAHVVATLDTDVTLLTPAGTPRVADDVVVNTVLGTITDSEDTVVELSTALGGDDTTSVELEGSTRSSKSNGDGLLSNSSSEGSSTLLDGLITVEVLGRDDDVSLGSRASLVTSLVGVRSKGSSTVVTEVLKGAVHQTTVATLVLVLATSAVNKLLLRELDELVTTEDVSRLDSSNSGESPARTALALILNGTNDLTLLAPVNGSRSTEGVDLDGSLTTDGGANGLELGVSSELISGHISELSDTHGEGLVTLSVVLEDGGKVVLEGGVLGEEVLGLVLLLVGVDEASEEELVLSLGERSRSNSSRGSNKKSSLHIEH